MGIRCLCIAPHPVLRKKALPVKEFSEATRKLSKDLIDTMYANDGIGLAAPQIGLDVQMFVANPSQKRGQELVWINPVLEPIKGRARIVEGCLSLPDIWERVWRSSHIRIRGFDASGRNVAMEVEGLLAIVLQHEWDHLQGRLFIDRLPWFRRPWIRTRRQMTHACT
ncbi:MAG: peptide deformylase [Candidatus Omnitrophica bacterium]|nr:peptide deformylase [Candidatus Omnitrophota bacterium]